MKRANPSDIRKCAEVAEYLKRAGVLFVPMPVLDESDHAVLLSELQNRLEAIATEAEAESNRARRDRTAGRGS